MTAVYIKTFSLEKTMNAEIFGKVFFAGWQAAKEGFPYDRRSIDFTGEGCDEKRLRALFRIPCRGGAFSEGRCAFQGLQR